MPANGAVRYAFLERVDAVQFSGFHSGGKSNPAKLVCEQASGERSEILCKWPSICGGAISLVHEVVAIQLAGDLGLPVVQPWLVDLSPEFVAATRDDRLLSRWKHPDDLVGFGLTMLSPQVVEWGASSRLTPEDEQAAAAIFFFDAVTCNSDRSVRNSNLISVKGRLRAIDHEFCFSNRRLLLPPPPPWAVGGMQDRVTPGLQLHPLAGQLKRLSIDFDQIRMKWSSLPDTMAASYLASIPPEWSSDRSAAESALAWVEKVVENLDGCISEARRVLSHD
jgi:hypothetical protein